MKRKIYFNKLINWNNFEHIYTTSDLKKYKNKVICFWYNASMADMKHLISYGWIGKLDSIKVNNNANEEDIESLSLILTDCCDLIEDDCLNLPSEIDRLNYEEEAACNAQTHAALPSKELLLYYDICISTLKNYNKK